MSKLLRRWCWFQPSPLHCMHTTTLTIFISMWHTLMRGWDIPVQTTRLGKDIYTERESRNTSEKPWNISKKRLTRDIPTRPTIWRSVIWKATNPALNLEKPTSWFNTPHRRVWRKPTRCWMRCAPGEAARTKAGVFNACSGFRERLISSHIFLFTAGQGSTTKQLILLAC